MRIGYSPESAEGTLGEPRAVVTGSNGLIYVGDAGSMSVKVYDEQAGFVRQFGGRGRGKGRILSIQAMATDGDEIVVADAYRRAFTWWSLDGAFKREVVLSHELGWPKQFARLQDRRWLLLYLTPPLFRGPVLHVRSEDLRTAEQGLAALDDLFDVEDVGSLFVHGSRPGRFALLADGAIAYAPGAYDGRVYFLRKGEMHSAGRLCTVIRLRASRCRSSGEIEATAFCGATTRDRGAVQRGPLV